MNDKMKHLIYSERERDIQIYRQTNKYLGTQTELGCAVNYWHIT